MTMLPRLRTVALLMLLAGLSLGVFASRALVALGERRQEPAASSRVSPAVEQQVAHYQRYFQLDEAQTERIRQELLRYDRRVRDLLWNLRQQHAEEFVTLSDEAQETIRAILEDR